MDKYDLVIIGGGAAGMMAAISAKRNTSELSVAIVDRTFSLGRKILVSGGGRCNITNENLRRSPERYYYDANQAFIKSTYNKFPYTRIIKFFEELGIELFTEEKGNLGKVFPVMNQAQGVRDLLEDEIKRLGITIVLEHEVISVKSTDNRFVLELKDLKGGGSEKKISRINATKLIISTGGKSYPGLGSDGSGFKIAETLGHKIVRPVPSGLALEGKNPLSQKLQGVKVSAEVTVDIQGKEVCNYTGDVMFTKYGLSGTAILNISRDVSVQINRKGLGDVLVRLNFLPGRNTAEVSELLEKRWEKRPEQSLEKSLVGVLQTKVSAEMLNVLKIDKNKQVQDVTEKEKGVLVNALVDFKINITGTRGWNEAEFTAGGVPTEQLDDNMQSRLVPGLYFCGEIVNVDGQIGGFNLSWAWASGWIAGQLD